MDDTGFSGNPGGQACKRSSSGRNLNSLAVTLGCDFAYFARLKRADAQPLPIPCLERLLLLLRNRLGFVVYDTEDRKMVYSVFEVLNSRGTPVSCLRSAITSQTPSGICLASSADFYIDKSRRQRGSVSYIAALWFHSCRVLPLGVTVFFRNELGNGSRGFL